MSNNSASGSLVKGFGRLWKDFVEYFDCFYKDPDPKEYNPATDYRWKWRPISQSPFHFITRESQGESASETPVNPGVPVAQNNDAPKWVHLFYDLAWTTTFSNLTENGRFQQPWDTVSYLAFFIIVWWIWAAQAMYTIHFYTNDWFHFASNIVQLCIFGMLSATTQGTIVLLVQYLRVLFHARKWNKHDAPLVRKISVVPLGMLVSIPLFIGAWTISTSATGKMPYGAKLKFVLWGVGLIVEILSHLVMARLPWHRSPRPVDEGSVDVNKIQIRSRCSCGPLETTFQRSLELQAPIVVFLPEDDSTNGDSIDSIKGQICPGCSQEPLRTLRGSLELQEEVVILQQEGKPAQNQTTNADKLWICPQCPQGPLQTFRSSLQAFRDALASFRTAPDCQESIVISLTQGKSDHDQGRLQIPCSNVTLTERLEAITTIILGEGINGIAGTLWAVISSPGYEKSVTTNAISAAVTVCFIMYFYFEGPASREKPKGLHQMIWLLLHLPFLLGIILLLLGVKDQFLLTSFLSTVLTSLEFVPLLANQGVNLVDQSSGNNTVVKEYFLKRGIKWVDQWEGLTNKVGPVVGQLNRNQSWEVIAWQWRLALELCVNTFETFMGEERGIPEGTNKTIELYNTNRTLPILDNRVSLAKNSTETMVYYQILDSLVEANVIGARYIIGLAGGIFICLALLNLAHSKPRDRFQWGIVLSRLAMGWALAILLLLNLGHFQTLWIYPELGQTKHQAGVFQWLTAYAVLPTIALAHLVELIIETFITGLARLRIDEISEEDRRAPKRAEAMQALEDAQGNGQEITEAMRMAAEPYVRPPLRQLAWRQVRPHVLSIRGRIVSILARVRPKGPNQVE